MKGNLYKIITSIVTLLIVTNVSFAQSSKDKIKIIHKQLKAYQLPAPGEKLSLSLLFPTIKDLSMTVRAFTVIDGKFLEVPMQGTLDERDRTLFSTTIRSPLAELTYQFFVTDPMGKTISTKKYNVRRECRPNTELTDLKIDESLTPTERTKVLIQKTKELEKDVNTYQNTLEIVKELEEIING